uniref:C-type lectin domain-containing protein n=1 Tax=Esox lucius TaxID=8010 RepID=A0A6Q2WSY8_ESOLU
MSEGIEFEGNVIGTNTKTDFPTYANEDDDKPKPASVCYQWWKRPSGVAAVCLGLLCVLLLARIIGLSVHYGVIGHQYFTERDKLQTSYNNLTEERDQLQIKYKTLTEERDQLQIRYKTLTEERDQLQTRYKTLTEERDQLQTRYKTLTEERDKLQSERESFLLVKVFGNSNYYVFMEQRNWEYAKQDCLKRGAQLVIINNQEEQVLGRKRA